MQALLFENSSQVKEAGCLEIRELAYHLLQLCCGFFINLERLPGKRYELFPLHLFLFTSLQPIY